MLKGIALAGVFFLASAISPAMNAAPRVTKSAVKAPPVAPAPHGLCPNPWNHC
jgi:hypothetical protein